MDPFSYDTQEFLKIATGLVGISSILWLRSTLQARSRRIEFQNKKSEYDTKIGFSTSYPNSDVEDGRGVGTNDISQVRKNLKQAFDSGITQEYEWRMEQLGRLKTMIEENRKDIIEAVMKDLGKKHSFEVIASEINIPLHEIEHTMKHLKDWVAPERVTTTIPSLPALSYIYKEPLGTVLIMSPWNYPVNLALVPLAGAIAGGNTAFVKFSRHTRATGKLLEKLLHKYMDKRCIVGESDGGAPMITRLCEEQWDHIFFTGSVSVGKVIYQAAAKYLTPVILELGGKNPCIVDKNIDLDLAAKRIAWGKFFNCGQTCVGVDYILCHRDVIDAFINKLIEYIIKFYGNDAQKSECYGRVISTHHVNRLKSLFQYGNVVYGGVADEKDRYVSPTIIRDPKLESELMTDEIFGPVLPIIAVNDFSEAVEFINKRPLALSIYYYGKDRENQEKLLKSTRSGSCLFNESILHFTNPNLPFGGVGDSGIGQYHGKLTFDTFVHRKAVIKSISSRYFDMPFRYPPFNF